MLGQRQLIDRLTRVVQGQLLDAGIGGLPAVLGAGQGLVVLEPQAAAGNIVIEERLVGIHRLLVLALPGEQARLRKLVGVVAPGADGRFQPAQIGMVGLRLLETVQIHLGGGGTTTDCLCVHQTGQRGGIVGRGTQQLEPVLARQVVTALALPVARLRGELVGGRGSVLGLDRRGGAGQPEAQYGQPQHVFDHRGMT